MGKHPKDKSFNDKLMILMGVPIVLTWLGLAAYVIYMATKDPDVVLQNLDGFTAVLGLIGGPALLIITKMLDLWSNEQANEINEIPSELAHRRTLQEMEQKHALSMDAFLTKTEGKKE